MQTTAGRNIVRGFAWARVPVAVLLAVVGSVVALAAPASAPSFDCAKATAADEQAICANPYLGRIDVMVSAAFAKFTPEFGDKRAIGKALLADRAACGSDEACIAAAQVNALETYGDPVPWTGSYVDALLGAKAADTAAKVSQAQNQPLPKAIGACAMTHITDLTTRFGDPLDGSNPDAGSAVTFTNGGGLVSYDMEDAFYEAKAGDPVVVCLELIPRDCPRGDDRGRYYYGLDVRTGGTWALPDSQHMCGEA